MGNRKNNERYHKISKLMMIICMTVLCEGILFVHPAMAKSSGQLLMTIVANVNSNTNDSGHSFLVITNNTGKTVKMFSYNLKPGKSASISLRGSFLYKGGNVTLKTLDGDVLGGAYINAEVEKDQIAVYRDFAYLTVSIDEVKLKKVMESFAANSRYNVLTKNCTHATINAWNKAAPKGKKIKTVTTPKLLKTIISLTKGSRVGNSLEQCRLGEPVDSTAVFYVSKKKQLVPLNIDAKMKSNSWRKTSNSITLSLAAVENSNKYTSKKYLTGYLIQYKETNGSSSWTPVYVTDRSEYTIRKLKADTKYSILIRPVYRYAYNKYKTYSFSKQNNDGRFYVEAKTAKKNQNSKSKSSAKAGALKAYKKYLESSGTGYFALAYIGGKTPVLLTDLRSSMYYSSYASSGSIYYYNGHKVVKKGRLETQSGTPFYYIKNFGLFSFSHTTGVGDELYRMINGKYTLDVYYSYYRSSERYREGKLLYKKSTCDIPVKMAKARRDSAFEKYFVKLIPNTYANREKYLKNK